MPSVEELEDTLQAALTLVGGEAATIERRPSATIVPDPGYAESADARAAELFGELEGRRLRNSSSDAVALHGTIGEGGMGIVRLGTQRALRRPVAVKTLKDDLVDETHVLKLLREAWVTGRLEHPNIVPVYDIALDEGGRPQIVLKKIEGDEWASLMHDPEAVAKEHGTEDLLEWNLRILMQVCNAVHFAHSRGVLHRDLKPENVMIGAFGEVYLVDWGIAVSLEEDGEPWLPRARDAREMAGTPLYMAPEMLGGPESRLSVRTDVYLLGAVLCEIATGDPPHRGTGIMEIVGSIVESDPDLGEDTPPELARIIRRAMDPDPDARFENAEQVRLAIQGFLRHRDGAQLAARASAHLEELEALLAASDEAEEAPEERERIYELFGECRFGFRHALEVWPDNVDAREALDRAVLAMVEYELATGEPEAARALLGEMRDVPPELAARVAEARRKRAEEDAELRRVSADLDPNAGRRTRAFVALVVGAAWVAVPLGAGLAEDVGGLAVGHAVQLGYAVAFIALMGALFAWARESMMRTAINRRIAAGGLFAMLALVANTLTSAIRGVPPDEGHSQTMSVFAAIVAMLSVSVEPRLAISAVAYVIGYVTAEVFGYRLYVVAACNLILLVNMVTLWGRISDLGEAQRRARERRRARRRAVRTWAARTFGGRE